MAPPPGGDPLAWPGGLAIRLAVLALILVMTSLIMGMSLTGLSRTPRAADLPARATLDCLFSRLEAFQAAAPATTEAATAALLGCFENDPISRRAYGPLLLVAAAVVVAAAVFAAYPRIVAWRERVDPPSAAPPASLVAWIEEDIRALGLAGQVHVSWRLADPRPRARVFGRRRAYRLLLSGGMLGLALSDPAHARSVVRHELAHIRHGDVDVFFAAQSLWWGYVIGALGPFVLLTPWISRVGIDGVAGWALLTVKLAAVVLVPLAARNLLLHEIEHRADLGATTAPRTMGEGRNALLGAWRTHPDDRARRAVAAFPLRLLRVRAVELLLLGALAGLSPQLVLFGVAAMLVAPLPGVIGLAFGFTVSFLLSTVLFAAALAYFVLRDRVAARLLDAPPHHPARIAALTTLGLVGGLAVSLLGTMILLLPFVLPGEVFPEVLGARIRAWSAVDQLLTIGAALLLLLATLTAAAGWLAMLGDAWARAFLEAARPGRIIRLAMIAAALVLSLPLGFAYFHLVFLPLSGAFGMFPPGDAVMNAFGLLVFNPLTLPALLALGLLPFLGGRLQRDAAFSAGPRLLATGRAVTVLDPRPAWGPLGAGVAIFCLLFWEVLLSTPGHRVLLGVGVPADRLGYLAQFLAPPILAAIAAAVAWRAPRLPWAHAIATCVLGGLVGGGAVWPFAVGGVGDVSDILYRVNGLAILALSMAVPLVSLALAVRHRPVATVEVHAPTDPGATPRAASSPAGT